MAWRMKTGRDEIWAARGARVVLGSLLTLAALSGCAGVEQVSAPQRQGQSLDQGLEALSHQLISSLPEDRKLLVAVLDFNDLAGCVSAFGRLVGEELVTKLFQTQRLRVVERSQLEKALNELMFNLSGVVDPTEAKQHLHNQKGLPE